MVTINKLGENQNATGDACGAFCIAAIASGMGIIDPKVNSEKIDITYDPDGKNEVSVKLDKKDDPLKLAKEMYKVAGNLLQKDSKKWKDPNKPEYEYTNKQHLDVQNLIENKNSVSGLALVASKLGMKVKVNAKENCGIEDMNIFSIEKKSLQKMDNVVFNENQKDYKKPTKDEAQIVCVHENGDPFAHWIAVDSDSKLYDPRTDTPKELNFDSSGNEMKAKNGKYTFSGLWITLSK